MAIGRWRSGSSRPGPISRPRTLLVGRRSTGRPVRATVRRRSGSSTPGPISRAKILMVRAPGKDSEHLKKRVCCGETPLHHAANYGHWEVAQRLIEARADLEAKDNYGKTPWERANMNGEEKVMGVLRPVQVGLLSGRTVRCDPNPCLTVRELREEAQSKLGRGFQIQQLLTRSGQVLQDPLTLEDAGVTYGDFVTAIAPVAGEAAREREGLSLCVDARPSTDLRVVELEEEEKPC
ncbi:unnamed protein product [Durusdinium trenchii]|uniref:Ubiquitin-like domain-containing protein n=1 Tax=Durusdinium trenchii TaxID=1381693 RepID=A0ABP0M5V2_9DINO